jgi:hypothetical protein
VSSLRFLALLIRLLQRRQVAIIENYQLGLFKSEQRYCIWLGFSLICPLIV